MTKSKYPNPGYGDEITGILMDSGSENFELIVLALVTGFVLLQLGRVLGKKTGYDGKDEKDGAGVEDKDNVIPLHPEEGEAREDENIGLPTTSPFYDTVMKIHKFDNSFHLGSFLDGAESAYGYILDAFWKGDKSTMRSLLNRDVFEQFSKVVDDLDDQKHHFDNSLRDVEKIDLEDASIEGSLVELSLKFTSHMVLVTKDAEDRIISGDATEPVKVVDIWTFCRDVKSRDPNWTLVATRNA